MKTLLSLVLGGALAGSAAWAEDHDAIIEFGTLRPDLALAAAQAAMEDCREAGYQVGVAVVDRGGNLQVFLRDRFAGAHTAETAERKAWTAVSFRGSTLELGRVMQPGHDSYGVRFISKALPLGGGLPIMDGEGSIVGGIGISGAPAPEADEVCAEAGIAAIEDEIAF